MFCSSTDLSMLNANLGDLFTFVMLSIFTASSLYIVNYTIYSCDTFCAVLFRIFRFLLRFDYAEIFFPDRCQSYEVVLFSDILM